MDMEQELHRLQSTEREYMEYLKAQCESVGADPNVEGLENPKLALACRYALANPNISLRDQFAANFAQGLVTSFEYGATLQRLFDPNRAIADVAAKKTLEFFPDRDVRIVCCDTRPSEHPDNYRFSADVEKWIGKPIEFIRNSAFETVDDVFEERRYMSGTKGARCTQELKKIPRLHYQAADDEHVFGFTMEEYHKRILPFEQRNPALHLIHILWWMEITKADCYRLIRQAGIVLPVMYQLGFNNNNCPGCVKASSPWYWSMVRKHFPVVFKRRCEQSRALGVRLVEIRHHDRIFLDELPEREFKAPRKKENLSCGPECGTSKP